MDMIAKAMRIVTNEIKTDQAYRTGWQANIAVPFQDEFRRTIKNIKDGDDVNKDTVVSALELVDIHAISNRAANSFLDILCMDRGQDERDEEKFDGLCRQEPMLKFFKYKHLPPHLQERSSIFCDLAETIVATFPPNEERAMAIRKLLEAKDAGVRAWV